jgi:antitoxin YefM
MARFMARILTMTNRVPLAAARNQLSDLIARVESTHERIILTKHGVDAAVLLAPADLEGLEMTIEILSDRGPLNDVVQTIRQAQEDVAQGKIGNLDDIVETLKLRAEEE